MAPRKMTSTKIARTLGWFFQAFIVIGFTTGTANSVDATELRKPAPRHDVQIGDLAAHRDPPVTASTCCAFSCNDGTPMKSAAAGGVSACRELAATYCSSQQALPVMNVSAVESSCF